MVRLFTEGHKRKISESKKGEKHPLFGKKIEDVYGLEKAQIWRKRMSEAKIGKHNSKTHNENIRKSHIGHSVSTETRRKLREFNLGKPAWNKGKNGIYSDETKQKIRNSVRALWKNEEYAKKMIDKFQMKPNGPELYLDFILQNYFPDEWEYVGDGGTIINGLFPDFINCNGKKKIIEIFGEYWHKRMFFSKYIPPNRTECGRKKTFKEVGYDALIIWEDELSDEKKIIEKIRSFQDDSFMY